jgi:hypothetical protein
MQAPRNKVTVYKDRNMVHRLIGDPNGVHSPPRGGRHIRGACM